MTLFLPDICVDWETHNVDESNNKLIDLIVTYNKLLCVDWETHNVIEGDEKLTVTYC